jgi:hypothetical protein
MKEIWVAGVTACVLMIGGCDQARDYLAGDPEAPPDAAQVAPYYDTYNGLVDVQMSGNVAEILVRQPQAQLVRGGSLWARVGPYIYLFTPSTRQAFNDFPGLAAVRVVTMLPDGTEVARAMLRRDALGEIRWRRSLNLLGHALRDGQENPRRLEELTEWGETYTEYRYNPRFVSR